MNIPNEMIVNQVEHRHGGNAWAVVAHREGEWMDLINASKITPVSQIFHCWSKCVKLEKKPINEGTPEKPNWVNENVPIHPEILEKVKDIRDRLSSGLWSIQNTRLVKSNL